eukprot:5255146-Pleurochrysis_carterae.AAC.2
MSTDAAEHAMATEAIAFAQDLTRTIAQELTRRTLARDSTRRTKHSSKSDTQDAARQAGLAQLLSSEENKPGESAIAAQVKGTTWLLSALRFLITPPLMSRELSSRSCSCRLPCPCNVLPLHSMRLRPRL